jgi:phosphatidylglycerophosphate synthase
MDTVPKRSIIAAPYRFVLTLLEKYLRFPVKNPDVYTVIALLLSFLFLVIGDIKTRFVLLLVVLFFDWIDGAAARKFKGVSKRGYVVDQTFDKMSDGIIVTSVIGTGYGKVLFLLYLINNLVYYYSIKSGKHYIMPIRFFYLVILFIQMFQPHFFS